MRLGAIAHAVGASSRADGGDEDEDENCKRLKERLKGAMELEGNLHALSPGHQERATWMEYIFGICKPDGRIGEMGSR